MLLIFLISKFIRVECVSRTYKSEYSSEFGYIDKLIAGMQLVNGQVVVPKLNVVETYLLSAAAKDLSILIAVKRVSRSILNKV